MSAFLGRKATFTPATSGPVLTGLRTKSVSVLGEPIDISDDDSDGWAEFLTEAPRKGISLSVEGLTKDKNLISAVAQAGGVLALTDYVLDFPDLAISWQGNFVVSGLEIGLEHEGVSTFSATIQSNGVMVFDDDTTN